LISGALIIVGLYIAYNALESLFEGHHPKPTSIGIVVMFFVSLIMFIVGSLKKKIGKEMNNPVILAESNFTLMDAALSGSIMCGLVLNMFFGWWWIDQSLALIIAGNALREGLKGMNILNNNFFLLSNNSE
jgi:divalent metal cation (Fe/Co/Zn/Cd) transporter